MPQQQPRVQHGAAAGGHEAHARLQHQGGDGAVQVRRAQVDERVRRRARPSVLRRDRRRRRVRAEGPAAGHLHDRSVAREARHADADGDDRREADQRRRVHVQESEWHSASSRCSSRSSTAVLIFAGGLVTSTGSGLSVPDWPNTYGWFMFTFPLEKMVGGIRYEHSHRLIASTVGFLILVLAVWLWRAEPRAWVRRLGYHRARRRHHAGHPRRHHGALVPARIRSRSRTPAWRRSSSA